MELFDTRTTRIQPLPEREVRMYVCGVTPYDTTHLGHAFTFVHADVLARTLRRLGRRVVYVAERDRHRRLDPWLVPGAMAWTGSGWEPTRPAGTSPTCAT